MKKALKAHVDRLNCRHEGIKVSKSEQLEGGIGGVGVASTKKKKKEYWGKKLSLSKQTLSWEY